MPTYTATPSCLEIRAQPFPCVVCLIRRFHAMHMEQLNNIKSSEPLRYQALLQISCEGHRGISLDRLGLRKPKEEETSFLGEDREQRRGNTFKSASLAADGGDAAEQLGVESPPVPRQAGTGTRGGGGRPPTMTTVLTAVNAVLEILLASSSFAHGS
ncbi:hypothetical protein BHE74_00002398 [Ensete ventricosum]|nr:hypothetical protein BHE74_00002398 [Ensete ventricosum]